MTLSRVTAQVSVDDEATLLSQTGTGSAIYRNASGSDTIYIGGAGVTDTTGFPVLAGECYDETGSKFSGLAPLYGVCASGDTATVYVMAVSN